MTILTREQTSPQQIKVEIGMSNGLTHEIVKQVGAKEYLTRCGSRITQSNVVVFERGVVTCGRCELRNDADFRARVNAANSKKQLSHTINKTDPCEGCGKTRADERLIGEACNMCPVAALAEVV